MRSDAGQSSDTYLQRIEVDEVSDHWIRIVPTDPEYVPTPDQAGDLVAMLTGTMPYADEIAVNSPDEIRFVDAGANGGEAGCPGCGAELDDDWWLAAVGESYERSAFGDRHAVVPCCGAQLDLNQLDYGNWPVAFARWWVDCMNPGVGRLDESLIRELQSVLGHRITVVYRHL